MQAGAKLIHGFQKRSVSIVEQTYRIELRLCFHIADTYRSNGRIRSRTTILTLTPLPDVEGCELKVKNKQARFGAFSGSVLGNGRGAWKM